MQMDMRNKETAGKVPVRTNHTGSVLATPTAGKYSDAAINGRLFYAANINMVATSTTLNTTFVGLGLCNPSRSGKIVIVHEFSYAFVVASAAALVLALATTDDTGFADDVNAPIKCTRFGKASSVCYTDEGGAITAPVIVKIITQQADANINTYRMQQQVVDLGGSIILDPGRSVVTDTTTVVGASGAQFAFMWEEIDI